MIQKAIYDKRTENFFRWKIAVGGINLPPLFWEHSTFPLSRIGLNHKEHKETKVESEEYQYAGIESPSTIWVNRFSVVPCALGSKTHCFEVISAYSAPSASLREIFKRGL